MDRTDTQTCKHTDRQTNVIKHITTAAFPSDNGYGNVESSVQVQLKQYKDNSMKEQDRAGQDKLSVTYPLVGHKNCMFHCQFN